MNAPPDHMARMMSILGGLNSNMQGMLGTAQSATKLQQDTDLYPAQTQQEQAKADLTQQQALSEHLANQAFPATHEAQMQHLRAQGAGALARGIGSVMPDEEGRASLHAIMEQMYPGINDYISKTYHPGAQDPAREQLRQALMNRNSPPPNTHG